MKRLLLATVMLGAMFAPAVADTLIDDPLHGLCAGCATNGTNTPIQQNNNNTVQQFGFASSPPQAGTLILDVLVPNNTNLNTFIAPTVSGSAAGQVQLFTNGFGVGLNNWQAGGVEGVNPTLAGFLGNGASPDQNLMAYLPSTQVLDPGASGFFVFSLNAGHFSLAGPGSPLVDLFDLDRTLPSGAYIVAFLLPDAGGSPVATANSSALFVQPAVSAVPLPATLPMLLSGLMLGGGLLWRKKKQGAKQ